MHEPHRFPLKSLPTAVIVSVTAVLASAALLARIYWLAGWLVSQGALIWLNLPTVATQSRGRRFWSCVQVVGFLGLGLMGLVELWGRW